MNRTIGVPILSLPPEFTEPIHKHIRLYSVTMLMAESVEDDAVIPCSGTLCSFDAKVGILTCRHVWDEAQKHKMLILVTRRGPFPLTIKDMVPAIPQPQSALPHTDATVPDLAFLSLDLHQKAAIESLGKVFYNINNRMDSPHLNVQSNEGYWAVFGNPNALLKVNEHTTSSLVYGTGVKYDNETDGWDYLSVDLNIPENPQIPGNFEGVSGGGVWRTIWGYDSDQKRFVVSNLTEDCIFVGACFYQTGGDKSQLIAHGPNSIYKKLPGFI